MQKRECPLGAYKVPKTMDTGSIRSVFEFHLFGIYGFNCVRSMHRSDDISLFKCRIARQAKAATYFLREEGGEKGRRKTWSGSFLLDLPCPFPHPHKQ